MAEQTIECENCGHANPAWAQVCRNCGVLLATGMQLAPTAGRIPSDQASLMAIGAALGSIVLAVAIGLFLSALIPAAPNVAEATPTPSPTPSETATPTEEPSEEPSVGETVEPTPALPGRVTFGFDLNQSTREAIDISDTFGPGQTFAHSISMPTPFGVTTIFEEVIRVETNGDLTTVQARADGGLTVSPSATIAGFSVPANNLLSAWGAGTYIFRDYIGSDLIAEGTITLTE